MAESAESAAAAAPAVDCGCAWRTTPLPCVRCTYTAPPERRETLLLHMLSAHSLVVAEHEKIVDLASYLAKWKQWLAERGDAVLTAMVHKDAAAAAAAAGQTLVAAAATGQTDLHAQPDTFYLLGGMSADDEQLRARLNRACLDEALDCQLRGRKHVYDPPMLCFFCKAPHSTPFDLVNHLHHVHGFRLGIPDNLVHITVLLSRLNDEIRANRCLRCFKTFDDHLKLKNHLRKKGHYQLNPDDHSLDQFYLNSIVNPGTPWQELAAQNENAGAGVDAGNAADAGDDEADESWTWHPTASCPFCRQMAALPQAMFDHWQKAHGFNYEQLCQTVRLTFYDSVRLVNYIRRRSDEGRCAFCNGETAGGAHFAPGGCAAMQQLPADAAWRTDDSLLQPCADAEHLLIYLDIGDDESDTELDANVHVYPEEQPQTQRA